MSRCVLRVGRLIDHPCGRSKAKPCKHCGRDVCRRHRNDGVCKACSGDLTESIAPLAIEDFGDPMDFAPEVYAAFHNRAGAPEDELAGVDS